MDYLWVTIENEPSYVASGPSYLTNQALSAMACFSCATKGGTI